jgi:hypothetical protein
MMKQFHQTISITLTLRDDPGKWTIMVLSHRLSSELAKSMG